MNVAAVALLMVAFLPAAALADCWSTYVSCSSQCCDGAGGNFTEGADSVHCTSSQGNVYHSCDSTCTRQEIDCLAPGSGCSQQYSSCTNGCGGPGGSSCNQGCSDSAFSCTDAASSNSHPGTSPSSSCCGAFILLGLAGSGALLFARRR